MRKAVLFLTLALVGLVVAAPDATPAASQAKPFLGAWNINGTGPDTAQIYWLEVTEEAGQLHGMFLNRVGNPTALGIVKVENNELIFRSGTAERPNGPEYHATIEDGKLIGHHSVTQGRGGRGRGAAVDPNAPAPPPPTERVVNWVGVRPPTWPASDANAKHTYGTPVVLFDNKSLDMWDVQVANRPMGWSIVDGAMTNVQPPPTDPAARSTTPNNLVSKQKFTDFKVEAEYKLGKESNSGIYLRGRYELQLLEDFADTKTPAILSHMSIYGRTPPLVKASKPEGEWQAMEAVLVGNRVTVTLNGQKVQDNTVILGVTGGMLDNDELAPGPLLVQGDHSGVTIRKLVVTPITK